MLETECLLLTTSSSSNESVHFNSVPSFALVLLCDLCLAVSVELYRAFFTSLALIARCLDVIINGAGGVPVVSGWSPVYTKIKESKKVLNC